MENISPNTIAYTSPTPCDLNIRLVVKTDSTIHDIAYANREPIACIQVLESRELLSRDLIVQEVECDKTLTIDGVKKNALAGVYTVEAIFPFANFEESLVSSSIAVQIKD